jgi:pimeloyl-ACP methyl ester carboxylesterase
VTDPSTTGAGVAVRRAFVDARFGQVHLRHAGPVAVSGRPPLLCFHQSPNASSNFALFLGRMGTDRLAVAPDTPGFGESDRPAEPPEIADYAGAMADVLDALEIDGPVDLLGYHTGVLIAAELALLRPQQIRRLVLIGIPVFNAEERAAFEKTPWPVPFKEDGSSLVEEWQRLLHWRGPGVELPTLRRFFAEKMRAGDHAWWGARAVFRHDTRSILPRLKQPILAVRPKDDLWDSMPRARDLIAPADWVDLPGYGHGMFDVIPDELAVLCRRFLDAP